MYLIVSKWRACHIHNDRAAILATVLQTKWGERENTTHNKNEKTVWVHHHRHHYQQQHTEKKKQKMIVRQLTQCFFFLHSDKNSEWTK